MKMYIFIMVVVFSVFFTGCGKNSNGSISESNGSFSENNESGGGDVSIGNPILQGHPEHVKHILFAHGYHDDKLAWNTFAAYIKNNAKYSKRWHIHRTSVAKTGSIAKRAKELAEYINTLNIADDSMLIVAHSMGGLDSHYIISRGHKEAEHGDVDSTFYKAAKKIHKLYTLATPHRGNAAAGNDTNDAVKDMGIHNMRAFNAKYPYIDFSIDGRKIPMLAFRFTCYGSIYSDGNGSIFPGTGLTDGTVSTNRQMMFGAPHTQSIFRGRHTKKAPNTCRLENMVETKLADTILKGVLDNKQYYTDSYDIVLYEHEECKGEEAGYFSSRYEDSKSSEIPTQDYEKDKTTSVMIYPGIRSDYTIRLYDNPDGNIDDDWTRIHIGNTTLDKPFCISKLEHQTYNREKDKNITVTHYHKNGLNGKVSMIKLDRSNEKYGPIDIVAYEGENCDKDIIASYNSRKTQNDSWVTNSSSNDKVQSLLLYPHTSGKVKITLYNSPDKKEKDGFTEIELSGSTLKEQKCIRYLDNSYTYTLVNTEGNTTITKIYHKHTNHCLSGCGVSGKVSDIKIEP